MHKFENEDEIKALNDTARILISVSMDRRLMQIAAGIETAENFRLK